MISFQRQEIKTVPFPFSAEKDSNLSREKQSPCNLLYFYRFFVTLKKKFEECPQSGPVPFSESFPSLAGSLIF